MVSELNRRHIGINQDTKERGKMELYEQYTTKCFVLQDNSDKCNKDISELNEILNNIGVSF